MSKARGGAVVDQIVKLVVGAGQASPSPPVGPALGSKGIKSMDFCKVCPPSVCELLCSCSSTKSVSGVQRSHTTHHSRHAITRPRNSQARPHIYIRRPHTPDLLAPSQRSRSTTIEGWKEERSQVPRKGNRRHRQLEACLRDRQDQAVGTEVIRSFARGSLQGDYLSSKVDGCGSCGLKLDGKKWCRKAFEGVGIGPLQHIGSVRDLDADGTPLKYSGIVLLLYIPKNSYPSDGTLFHSQLDTPLPLILHLLVIYTGYMHSNL